MGVKEIKSYAEYKEVISSGKPVLIDFTATWCGPCRFIGPIFASLADKEGYENVEFYKLDVDDQSEAAQEAGVRAMPTFKLFKDGVVVDDVVGASTQSLEALVQKGLALV